MCLYICKPDRRQSKTPPPPTNADQRPPETDLQDQTDLPIVKMPHCWKSHVAAQMIIPRGYCYCLRLSVMLSLPKPFGGIQPNLVCELHEWGMQQQLKIWPCPLGPLGGVKRSNFIKISITKSISKIIIPNFLFVLRNERYRTGFLWDLGASGAKGVKKCFFKHGRVGMMSRTECK